MKLLIQLTSFILFSFSITAFAETPTVAKVNAALQDFAQQMGRELTAEETESIGNMLLAGKSPNSFQAVAATTEQPTLNMACGQMQISSPTGRIQRLLCLADNFNTYSMFVLQSDSPGLLLVPIGVAYVRVTGPAVTELATSKYASHFGTALSTQDGITSSVYAIGGGDLSYFADDKGSTVSIAGLGLGAGISVGGTGIRKEEGPVVAIVKSTFQFDPLR